MRTENPNRELPEEMVLDFLREYAPDAIQYTRRVGSWLWIEFPSKPPEQTRAAVKEMGFGYSKRRSAWLHPCGHPVTRPARGYDPRDKYGSVAVEEQE